MAGGSNLFQGTLDLLVLRTVLDGPMHGYAIGRCIRDVSGGGLNVEEGALYPALHRLKKRRVLDAEWGITDQGRRARFYSITEFGRARLESESARWSEHVDAVGAVLRGQLG
jgi:PadR family transcriptional regulator PadR